MKNLLTLLAATAIASLVGCSSTGGGPAPLAKGNLDVQKVVEGLEPYNDMSISIGWKREELIRFVRPLHAALPNKVRELTTLKQVHRYSRSRQLASQSLILSITLTDFKPADPMNNLKGTLVLTAKLYNSAKQLLGKAVIESNTATGADVVKVEGMEGGSPEDSAANQAADYIVEFLNGEDGYVPPEGEEDLG